MDAPDARSRRPWWDVDRRWIFLLVAVGTIFPLVRPLGLAVRPTEPVRAIFDRIESLSPGEVVLVSFDYGPSTGPENDPMAAAVLRHCFARRLRVVGISLFPVGGLTMLNQELGRVTGETDSLADGVDYVNLGYKDGAQAAMRQMAVDIHAVFPADSRGRAIGTIPLMKGVHTYRDVSLAVTLTSSLFGEYWANLVNAQFGLPVAVGCTAVLAPKYYAYLRAGQMLGLMGGLKGASEYEKLLLERYPRYRGVYQRAGGYTATKGMDVQSIVHVIIIAFIIMGNVVALGARRAARRRAEER